MKKTIVILVCVAVLALVVGLSIYVKNSNNNRNTNIAPSIIMQRSSDKSDLIIVISPVKDSKISSPLSVAGRAKGFWFFEGSFPIILKDQNGKIIAEGHVSAQGNWMTESFVKFIGTLQFDKPVNGEKGTLVFKKDNPSGLPENDDSYEIPVSFK